MTTTLMWIVIILMAIAILVNAIRNEELKNRVTHLEKDNRFIGERLNSMLEVFEHSTKIVESTERMSDMFCSNSKWMMETTDNAISAIGKELDDIRYQMSNNDKIYQSLSKRNELLDEELRKTCKCCEDMQQRMALVLTPPQIKPIPMPELSNDPNQFQTPCAWDQVFKRNDSISESTIPNSQTDPVGFLGKAIHVAQSAAAAVNGMKDLAESAVEAVKESIDSVPDPDEIEPAEWLEDGREEGAEEELRNGPGEATDD